MLTAGLSPASEAKEEARLLKPGFLFSVSGSASRRGELWSSWLLMCAHSGERGLLALLEGPIQPRRREPELYQAAKVFEFLPQKSNDLWQLDVTYIHIRGHDWRYAVTVINYLDLSAGMPVDEQLPLAVLNVP